MAPGPALDSVVSGSISYVFFVDNDRNLKVRISPVAAESSDARPYKTEQIYMDGGDKIRVGASNSALAAAAWTDGGNNRQMRVYYVDDNGALREIYSTNGDGIDGWKKGKLTGRNIKITPGTDITASAAMQSQNQLKVFYYDASIQDRPFVAWQVAGNSDGEWTNRAIDGNN